MNFTNKQKLYLNVFLLFVGAFLLTTLFIQGFKTNHFKPFKIVIVGFGVFLALKNIKKYNT